jgi:hypothetical protein
VARGLRPCRFDLAILGVAIATYACVQRWNAAEHRKAGRVANAMAVLFCAFTAIFALLLGRLIFFDASLHRTAA